MGVIWTPQQRTTQPTSYRINWANPLTSGLVALFTPDRELLSQAKPSTVNAASLAPGSQGVGTKFTSTSNSYQIYDAQERFNVVGDLSIAAFMDAVDSTDYGAIISTQEGSTTYCPYELRLTSSPGSNNLILLRARGSGNYQYSSASPQTLPAYGALVGVTSVPDLSIDPKFYWNGVLQTTTNITANVGAPLSANKPVYIGGRQDGATHLNGTIFYIAVFNRILSAAEWSALNKNKQQLFVAPITPKFFPVSGGGSTATGAGSSAGVGAASGVGASTSAQVGSSAGVGAASGVGASTADSVGSSSGTGAADGIGSSTGGSDGVGASTGTGTASGIGASTAASTGSSDGVGAGSGVGASTSASTGSASGTGTASGVGTNGSVVSTGVGSASGTGTATGISPTVSRGGGKTTGSNLSRKQKKKLKAVESQEWLKAEETARQLLSDRFTKQTPQEKAQALETHIESLAPVIEALKALTDQIEDVQETVQETKTEELTEHKQILNKFDALITKMTSIEELLIIMLAQ